MKTLTVTQLVKENTLEFVYFRDGEMIYDVLNPQGKKVARFPVNVWDKEDASHASFERTCKAITLMRYIRKAIKDEKLFVY